MKQVALEHGIEVLEPTTLRDNEEIANRLRELAPDAIPVVAYGNLVPASLLDLPHHGWVNLHFRSFLIFEARLLSRRQSWLV